MNGFKVIDFRFASIEDIVDEKYKGTWSRPYEYPYVLNFISWHMLKNMLKPQIHNSSWGFEGVHVIFRDELDKIGDCIHSDIVHSTERPTFYYDITLENKEFENKFDFVLNISTIEHLENSNDRLNAIENLFKQVKNGGYLILTFDYPRVNLKEIESLTNSKCQLNNTILNGSNSVYPNNNYKDLNIVFLVLKKNENE